MILRRKEDMKSNCCNALLTISTADEGTSCYICTKCQKPCDPQGDPTAFDVVQRFLRRSFLKYGEKMYQKGRKAEREFIKQSGMQQKDKI